METKNKLLQAALEYSKKGWRVFPCKLNKRPLIYAWQKAATTNTNQIKKWWRQHPAASIGIVCGEKSNLVVLDSDKKSGGLDSLRKLRSEYDLPATLKARTGGGGLHYYFQYPNQEVRNSTGKIAKGIDVRSEGGYVVVPPSKHKSGKRYRWINENKIKPLPVWLLKKITEKKVTEQPIVEGERHTTLLSLAGRYRNVGLDQRHIEALLLIDNKHCTPPHDIKDIKRIAKDIAEKRVAEPEAVIVSAAEIEPEHMKFLWPDRIPVGCTTIYCGMPGQAKSTQALDVAARISAGARWPNSALRAPKGSTLLIAQEDAVREVILWRYKAMDGIRKNLKIFKGIKRTDSEYLDWLDITIDLPVIEKRIEKIKDLKLIIFDPISPYFGKTDTYKNTDVRRVLGPLNILAQKYNIAILLIQHLNKNINQDILHRITGSTAFSEFARQVWFFGSDKEDEKRKLMVCAKKSYGAPTTGLAFKIKQVNPAEQNSIKLIYETAPVQESAREIFAEQKGRGRPAREREKAEDFLTRILVDGAVPKKTIHDLAASQNINERTLRRAASELKVKKVRPNRGKYTDKLCWCLPQNRSN